MTQLSYNDRSFRSLENSDSGEVGDGTTFHYHQDGALVWASYCGGEIRHGTLVALANGDGELDMRYHHLNRQGELKTGVCSSRPEVLPDGRLRLHETWQWTSGEDSSGTSLLEEIPVEEIAPAQLIQDATEAARIVRLLRSTFDGAAWHGPSLWSLVNDLTAQQAAAPPRAGNHSIWELVGHTAGWIEAVLRRIANRAKTQPEEDFPSPATVDTVSWQTALAALRHAHEKLCTAVRAVSEERLESVDPNSSLTVYEVVHGVVHHNLYHAGQIALLRRDLGIPAALEAG